MNRISMASLAVVLYLGLTDIARATELSDIKNYKEYSAGFSSAGQPSREQFELLEREGFERIVYIAFNHSNGAIDDEDQIVKDLGMVYVQVPVIWDAPLKSDFHAFAAAMQSAPGKRTLLHCQANFRASAFAFLYRVLYEGVGVAEAKADMNSVWRPNETWKSFIFGVLEDNGISPDCSGCDWSEE